MMLTSELPAMIALRKVPVLWHYSRVVSAVDNNVNHGSTSGKIVDYIAYLILSEFLLTKLFL